MGGRGLKEEAIFRSSYGGKICCYRCFCWCARREKLIFRKSFSFAGQQIPRFIRYIALVPFLRERDPFIRLARRETHGGDQCPVFIFTLFTNVVETAA